ncbi:MAG: response regulator [Candidatus Omnitrophota bacterium]
MNKGKKRVLIVDDDEEMCEEMGEILKGEGFLVDAVFNGLDAEKIMEQNRHDLVLLDMKLPGVLGTEILRIAKAIKGGAKILVMSGSDIVTRFKEESEAAIPGSQEALLQLADGIISKPFKIEDILLKVKGLLR